MLLLSVAALIALDAWPIVPWAILWCAAVNPMLLAFEWPNLQFINNWQTALKMSLVGYRSQNPLWRRIVWRSTGWFLPTCYGLIAVAIYLLPVVVAAFACGWITAVWMFHLWFFTSVIAMPGSQKWLSLRFKRGREWREAQQRIVEDEFRKRSCPTCSQPLGADSTVNANLPSLRSNEAAENWKTTVMIMCAHCGCWNFFNSDSSLLGPLGMIHSCEVEKLSKLTRLRVKCDGCAPHDVNELAELLQHLPEVEDLFIYDNRFDNEPLPLDPARDRLVDDLGILGHSACSIASFDESLTGLAGLPKLRRLELAHSRLTAAGLKRLESLSQLRELWLDARNVADAELIGLQHALPGCTIIRPAS